VGVRKYTIDTSKGWDYSFDRDGGDIGTIPMGLTLAGNQVPCLLFLTVAEAVLSGGAAFVQFGFIDPATDLVDLTQVWAPSGVGALGVDRFLRFDYAGTIPRTQEREIGMAITGFDLTAGILEASVYIMGTQNRA